ncbi:PTS galactitol transporter subunit IIA [Lacticaseibacillus chiayiensis]|uniref:PTS galactitol transporter subunit IIA n=1 Tax=Lacticaseibacillus chiayiensis TaxID=2100821 RepID=A0A4Q1U959_9LACO|nr:PTS sugar transporter subunit IIA [Lacticaseibacillus chiayiensis]QVI34427.1 PTS sugar transporter subunit IIA [Lacticaseibacillus chiayiensis]RXT27851.1 PTS galactitol transporter subunit IIA [Lacticaseibacillus chiayiensis]RXT58771.1 PTS galactitol transporter subunit IIA [Lacticaseibacillus chiayiensis]UYN56163.1 PTS sugar transporter subunit IIA [Lacticaseibacillus chiayiensis]
MAEFGTTPLVYFLHTPTQEDFFNVISHELVAQKVMLPAGKTALIEREKTFPSGMQLNQLADRLPNIAIPHLEGDLVQQARLVVVHFEIPVAFKDLADASRLLPVEWAFMLMNPVPKEQPMRIAQLIRALTQSPVVQLQHLFAAEKPSQVARLLPPLMAEAERKQ